MTNRNRPQGSNSGTQQWQELLFLHWPVAADAVQALLPEGLEVDTFEGETFVGLVPFVMKKVRPAWLPRQLALNFLETNVRVYVTCNGEPGVYFLSLEASSWLAVKAARSGWSLPYYYANMCLEPEGEALRYQSKRQNSDAGIDVRYKVGQMLGPSSPGTLAYFLLERYLLFSTHHGRLQRGQVHHEPYEAQEVEILELTQSLLGAGGLAPSQEQPPICHFAKGVDVEVFALSPVQAPL